MWTVADDPKISEARICVIGVGNALRGGDGAGPLAARLLRKRVPEGVMVLEASGEGATLMELWADTETVVLIDAVRSGAAPGTVFRFDAGETPLPTGFFHYSTHAFSVAEAVELARVLDRLPPRLIVYGIEGGDFAAGVGCSLEVERGVRDVVEEVMERIAEMRGDG